MTRPDRTATVTAVAVAAFRARSAVAGRPPQPAMEAEAVALDMAKGQLQAASPDRGGRDGATRHVDAVLVAAQLGVAFANS